MRWLLYSDYHLFLFQDQNLMPSIHFTYDKYVYQKLTILIISYMSDTIENVLILQGGGSLGAFGCGVFKALASNNIKIDIVAGTSIGGVNAAIIAGGKQEEHP
jgi:predicted acylesterase/phospholipase RssA